MRILGPDFSKGKKKVSANATEPRSKKSKLSQDCVEKKAKILSSYTYITARMLLSE